MNGPHDLGGKHGLGPIIQETDEPVFHRSWEGRMYGLAVAAMTSGCLTVDEKRHAIERMPYAEYYGSSYYERWLYGLEKVLTEKGLITKEELDKRIAEPTEVKTQPPGRDKPSELAAKVRRVLREGAPNSLKSNQLARFRPGDRVIAKNLNPKTHLRLPGYVKKKSGVVERHYGAFAHPAARAHELGRNPSHLYSVKFDAGELWGPNAEKRGDVVYLDLFEDYLEPA